MAGSPGIMSPAPVRICSHLFTTAVLIGGNGTGQSDSNACDAICGRDFYQPTNISQAPDSRMDTFSPSNRDNRR